MSEFELIASCWTTAGAAAPGRGDETSPHPLPERIEAAASAGFTGFGLVHADLVAAREHYGYRAMREMFESAGMRHLEVEFLGDWWTDGDRRVASDLVRRDLLAACDALGASHIKVAGELGDTPFDVAHCARELAELAAQADQVGARVSLEFLPMFNIRTLDQARTVVEMAGHRAAGVMLDLWHVARTDTPLPDIAALPSELIAAVELDDAAAEPVESLWEDTIDYRRLPGEGDLDVPGFINAVRATGWDGPWGVEILSEEYRNRPVAEAVADAYAATASQFAAAEARARG